MTAPNNSYLSAKAKAIEEVLSEGIQMFSAPLDRIWSEAVWSAMGVVPASRTGRHYHVHRFFGYELGGVIEEGYPRGDFPIYGDNPGGTTGAGVTSFDNMFYSSQLTSFPDANEDIGALEVKLTTTLRGITFNSKVTLGELQGEALGAFKGIQAARRLSGLAKNLARRIALAFYVNDSDNRRIMSLGASSGTGAYAIDTSAKTITFTPPEQTYMRLAKGDRVDIIREAADPNGTRYVRVNDSNLPTNGGGSWGDANNVRDAADAQTLETRKRLWVSRVDIMNGTVTLVGDPNDGDFATWATTGNIGDAAYLVPANSAKGGNKIIGMNGLNSYMKFGGSTNAEKYILGDEAIGTEDDGIINVEKHPGFRSFKRAINGVLTEFELLQILDRLQQHADMYGGEIDYVVTRPGAIRAAYSQLDLRSRIDRTGRPMSLQNQGEDGSGFVLNHGGKKYMFHTTNMLPYGELNAFRLSGNWDKVTIPANPVTGKSLPGENTPVDLPVQLAVPGLTRLSSPYFPMRNSSQRLTEASEMPGYLYMNMVPREQFWGAKLTGITEANVFSD